MKLNLTNPGNSQGNYAEWFQIAVENSDLGVWIHDITSDRLTWSNRLYETLGVQHDVEPRLDILQSLIHPEDKKWVQNEIIHCLANKTQYSVEYRSIRRDSGDTVWLRCTGEALFDSRGESFVMLGTAFDITHLKNAEFKAKAADRAKSEFLANMSHEIRTPMNGVMGMCQVLEQSNLTEHQSKLLKTIDKSGASLIKIIDDILDFSKAESGQLTLIPAPFNLTKCIEDVSTLLENARSKTSNFELLISCQPDLPTHYIGDAGRLRQVITNLLGNALRFTEEGHVLLDVSGNVKNNIAKLRFTFEDTGIGIPIGKRELIFDRFAQVDNSSTRKYGGTGLGLAIAKQIIGLMGGELRLESEVGVGSKFSFEISMPVKTMAQSESISYPLTTNANIIIVDDNNISQRILSEQISHWNWKPISTYSARQGLIALQEAHDKNIDIDLVLLDFEMPKYTGEDFLKAMRKHSRFDHIPVIVMSSTDIPNLSHRMKNMGASDYFLKPPQSSLLYKSMCKFLNANKIANDTSTVTNLCPSTTNTEMS